MNIERGLSTGLEKAKAAGKLVKDQAHNLNDRRVLAEATVAAAVPPSLVTGLTEIVNEPSVGDKLARLGVIAGGTAAYLVILKWGWDRFHDWTEHSVLEDIKQSQLNQEFEDQQRKGRIQNRASQPETPVKGTRVDNNTPT